MVYVYAKKDKEKVNPIDLKDGIKFKSLWKKAEKIEIELYNYFLVDNIMFENEDEETKRDLYKSIDNLKSFRENLKLKSNIVDK